MCETVIQAHQKWVTRSRSKTKECKNRDLFLTTEAVDEGHGQNMCKAKIWRDVGDWGQSVFQFGGDDTVYACKGTDLRVLTAISNIKTH